MELWWERNDVRGVDGLMCEVRERRRKERGELFTDPLKRFTGTTVICFPTREEGKRREEAG